MEQESMQYDVIIVGAGPAGLAAAIHLKNLAQTHQLDISVCILEKAAEVGAHILSGAVLEPTALNELIPDWQKLEHPLKTPAIDDSLLYLTKNKSIRMPTPPHMHNAGNYIVSLGEVCKFLADIAESLGVEIFPGFTASTFIMKDNQVTGIETGEMGRDKQGQETSQYQPGVRIESKFVLLAEGCRGSLAQQAIKKYKLAQNIQPQTYAIGLKELWEVDNAAHKPGKIIHTIGWPLDNSTYGGSFLYHLNDNKISLGFVIGLDYQNPNLKPFETLQQFKTHSAIKPYLENGQRICYGARALNEGGYQSIPELNFPGGMLIGCSAGFMNVPKIKGSHTAMKSGMLASEYIIETLTKKQNSISLKSRVKQSWVGKELKAVRNIRPGFKHGLMFGLANAALETYILRGSAPWTLKHHLDHEQLMPIKNAKPINYPKPDGKLTFDKMTSLSFSNVYHDENQPGHLKLTNSETPIKINLNKYGAPETNYCPANVYEIVEPSGEEPYLQINAQNCIHCKTCDIKDPTQNITWTPPEGGGGPNYSQM